MRLLLAILVAGLLFGPNHAQSQTIDLNAKFETYYASSFNHMDAQSKSSNGYDKVDLTGPLHGVIARAEATKSTTDLDRALYFVDNAIGQLRNLDGQIGLEWGPLLNGVLLGQVPNLLTQAEGMVPIARVAALIRQTPAFQANSTYANKATNYINIVHDAIFAYWINDPKFGYGGKIPDVPADLNGYNCRQYYTTGNVCDWNDKTALIGMNAVYLYRATGNTYYRQIAVNILTAWKRNATTVGTGWDYKETYEGVGQNTQNGSYDTDHGSRETILLIAAYEAGIPPITLADIQRFADSFADNMWNQSTSDPRCTNYINGANTNYRNSLPWENCELYNGWASVGKYRAKAQQGFKWFAISLDSGRHFADYNKSGLPDSMVGILGHLIKNEVAANQLSASVSSTTATKPSTPRNLTVSTIMP